MVAQEVIGLEMLEAEAGSAGGVDLDDAGDAERVRVFAFRRRGRAPPPTRRPGEGLRRAFAPGPRMPKLKELEPTRYA
jgi:hypothetical protein